MEALYKSLRTGVDLEAAIDAAGGLLNRLENKRRAIAQHAKRRALLCVRACGGNDACAYSKADRKQHPLPPHTHTNPFIYTTTHRPNVFESYPLHAAVREMLGLRERLLFLSTRFIFNARAKPLARHVRFGGRRLRALPSHPLPYS